MQHLRLRVMRESDIPAVALLNAAAAPELIDIGEDGFRALLPLCDVALIASRPTGEPIAFLLSLGQHQPYDSENYQYFERRGVRHQYIDRIVVASSAKGTGIGRALYESVFERARERGANEVTCEVNVDPLDEASAAFHDRMGFREVGRHMTRGGTVEVALLARDVFRVTPN